MFCLIRSFISLKFETLMPDGSIHRRKWMHSIWYRLSAAASFVIYSISIFIIILNSAQRYQNKAKPFASINYNHNHMIRKSIKRMRPRQQSSFTKMKEKKTEKNIEFQLKSFRCCRIFKQYRHRNIERRKQNGENNNETNEDTKRRSRMCSR